MTAKHTPGPWRAERTGPWDGWDGWEVIAKDGATVCNGLGSQRNPIREANARLIAAAPELLEAAKLVLEWYEAEDNHSGTDFYQRMQMCRDSEDAIRAAIAKATGETP